MFEESIASIKAILRDDTWWTTMMHDHDRMLGEKIKGKSSKQYINKMNKYTKISDSLSNSEKCLQTQ